MRSIVETCQPRPDVLEGGLTDRDFAAQLDRVVAGDKGYEIYTDPDRFFEITHPTSGLRELVHEVFGHITGGSGQAFLRAQTSFGGGKTHSLIALYHLAGGYRPFHLSEFVDDVSILPDGPVRIAAVVGDVLDPINGTESSGRTVYTLWGEIASQLGDEAWEAISASDKARTAPGVQAIRKMLDDGPTVIVIDEIAHHARICAKSGDPDVRNQADQIAPFLKNLSEEIMARSDTVVVITLATRDDAYADETDQIQGILAGAMKDIRSVAVRKGGDIQPADESEIGAIL